MNLHTDDTIRAELEYRRDQLSRSWPKRRSRHKKRKEKELMKQPTSDLSSKDDAAIRKIVAAIEQAFNDNDPETLVRHIATDAIIVNPRGTVMRGPDEVEASVRPLLVGGPLQDVTAHYRLTDLTSLAPNVVVVHKNAWSDPQQADGGAPPQMNALYVFAKRDGAWWVLRRQNTTVGS